MPSRSASSPVTLTREQVVAYRVAAHGLHRRSRTVEKLAVLDIGVQDSGADGARAALAARLPAVPAADQIGPGRPLALVWSLRGAPHVHRRRDLDALAAALWPLSEADAGGRLNETGPAVTRAGIAAGQQWDLATEAMRSVVTRPTGKGAASTAVTAKVPAVMRRNCRGCGTAHISDSAMRSTFLAAGLELEPDTAPPVLLPRPGAAKVSAADPDALGRLVLAYLDLLGPAGPREVADYLQVRRADLEAVWPQDLVEVSVDGRPGWLPAARVAAARRAPAPEIVRLLGPFDPYLQARDRDLLVPDSSRHRAMWPVLGRPGAVLVDGEIAGIWRPRASGSRLTVVVEPFGPLAPSAWAALEDEAARLADVRGLGDAVVTGR